MLRERDSFLLREKLWSDKKDFLSEGERALTAASKGSAREPVSMSVTSGASQRRIVPGIISLKAKTPRPLDSEERISMSVPSVSG